MIHLRTMASPETPTAATRLDLGTGDEVAVRVALVPYLSVLTTAAASLLRAPDGEAAPRTAPTPGGADQPASYPDAVPLSRYVPPPAGPAGTGPRARLVDPAPSAQPPLPPAWRPVLNAPENWLHRFAALVTDAEHRLNPLCDKARAVLNQECERLTAALRAEPLPDVLAALHPRIGVDGTALLLPGDGGRHEIGGRTLVLAPMFSSDGSLVADLDGPDAVWVGYPVAPAGGSGSPGEAGEGATPTAEPDTSAEVTPGEHSGPATPSASLGRLLGTARATILATLHTPATMGSLARTVGSTPSACTYHCGLLEKAGLVWRERTGPEVRVGLTRRGAMLLEVMAD